MFELKDIKDFGIRNLLQQGFFQNSLKSGNLCQISFRTRDSLNRLKLIRLTIKLIIYLIQKIMKKRIKPVQIFQNALPITLHIDYFSPNKHHHDEPTNVKVYPKVQRRRSKDQQLNKLKIKQFNNPVVNELRQLVINCITSANYFAKCIKGQIPEAALKLYYQDSTKLTEYLNCLVVTRTNPNIDKSYLNLDQGSVLHCQKLDGFKKRPQMLSKDKNNHRMSQNQPQLRRQSINANKRVSLLQKVQSKFYDRKELRSQQSLTAVTNQMSRSDLGRSEMKDTNLRQKPELSQIKMRLQDQIKEKQNLKNINQRLSLELQNLKNNTICTELHLFRSEQVILEFASYFQNNHPNSSSDKQKSSVLLSSLDNYVRFTKKQNLPLSTKNTMLRMKHQIEQLTVEVSNYRRYSMQLIGEKQILVEQASKKKRHQQLQEDLQYEDMKKQINKMNEDLGDLMREVNRKDEFIELIKVDNDTLKKELIGLEKMNQRLNENERLLGQEMAGLQHQIQAYQIQIEKQIHHIQQLNAGINEKEKRILAHDAQIQSRQKQIIQIRKQFKAHLLERNEIISQLQQYIKIVELQKRKVEESYQNISKNNLLLKEKNRLLQDNIQRTLDENEEYERLIQNLKKRIQWLYQQNILLHQNIKMHDECKQQQNISLVRQQCSHLKYSNLSNDYQFRQSLFTPGEYVLGDCSSNSLINVSILQIIDQKAESGEQIKDDQVQRQFKFYSDDEKMDIMRDLSHSINNKEDRQSKNTGQYDHKIIKQDYQQGYYSDDDRLVEPYKDIRTNSKINKLQNDYNNQGQDHQVRDRQTLLSTKVNIDLEDEKQVRIQKKVAQFQPKCADYNSEIIEKCPLSFRQTKKHINEVQNNWLSQRKWEGKQEDFRKNFASYKKQGFNATNQVRIGMLRQSNDINKC